MAETLYVLNEGIILPTDFTATPAADTFNLKTSTNPTVITEDSSYSTDDNFSYYEIYDGEVSSFGGTKAAVLSTTNRQETPSYRVQLDTGSASGITLASGYDYYVLVYSDNIYKHHFAKLTEQTKYDGNFYNIDFTPKMKENVPSGTAVKIFKGPATSTSIVALGYGLINKIDSTLTSTYSTSSFNVAVSSSTLSVGDILISSHFPSGTKITEIVDSSNITVSSQPTSTATASVNYTTDERHDKYVNVSRPTFYFLEGDKLKPNHKYSLVKKLTSDAGSDIDKNTFFKTAPLSSDYILDKSFYTLHATIHDNNKDLDNNPAPNRRQRHSMNAIGSTYTFSATTWNDSSRNIYYSDSGHKTYIGFIDSPIRNQLIPSAVNIKTKKTITNRGNSFEAKFSDVTKMLDKKVKHNERIKVKEAIKQQNLSYMPNATLYGVYNNHTDSDKIQVSGLLEGQDLNTVLHSSSLSKYEQILIGSYYYLPSAISVASGGSQVITVANRRATSNSVYEGSTTVASMTDATAYRKEWSPVVSNFITTHPIDTVIESGQVKRNNINLTDIESDINGLEYRLDGEYYGFSIDVLNGDSVNGYVTFSNSPSSSYYASTDLFSSLKGKLVVNKTIFEGRIETIEKEIEMGQHFFKLSGRDDIGKLLSTPINKNYNYSNEYVYSTISPISYDTPTDTGLNISDTTNTNVSLITTAGSISTVGGIKAGSVLYRKYNSLWLMIGVVAQDYAEGYSGTIQLLNDSLLDIDSDNVGKNSGEAVIRDIYVGDKTLLAGKSLTSNFREGNVTSLYGSLDKGYRLLGNSKILENGVESSTTYYTFNNDGNDIDKLNVIQGSSSNRKDSPIGFNIDKDITGSISTISLIESDKEEGTDITNLQLGYVSPLVLGRMDLNTLDSFYDNTKGLYLINTNGLPSGGFIHLLNYKNNTSSGSPLRYGASSYRDIIIDDTNLGASSQNEINYAMRFGPPIYRYNNLVKGNLNFSRKILINNTVKTHINRELIDSLKSFNAYCSIFRIDGLNDLSNTYYGESVTSNLKELPPESKGYNPTVGSTGQDIEYYPDSFKQSLQDIGPRISPDETEATPDYKKYFERDDPMINNSFLFSVGDALPECNKRYDNPFTTQFSKNKDNLYLMVKYKSPKTDTSIAHDNYSGFINLENTSNKDYDFLPINTFSTTVPKRFNLLRLRTMTVDIYLNEVDYETYKGKSSFVQQIDNRQPIANSIPNGGFSVYPCHTTAPTSDSSPNIGVDNMTGLQLSTQSEIINMRLFTNPEDDTTGRSRLLGVIGSGSSTGLIVLTGNCAIDGYSGEIFIHEHEILSSDTAKRFIQRLDPYTNASDYKLPTTTNLGFNNFNIHEIIQTVSTGNQINTGIKRLQGYSGPISIDTVNNNRNFYQTDADILINGVTGSAGTQQTVTITFETLSVGSVAPNLSNYVSGDKITISGHSDSKFNITYDIGGSTSNTLTVTATTNTSLVNSTSYISANIISDKYRVNVMGCNHRLIQDTWLLDDANNVLDNDVYVGMDAVVVKNGENGIITYNANANLLAQKSSGLLNDNNYGTNITKSQTVVDSLSSSIRLITSDRYIGATSGLNSTAGDDFGLNSNFSELLFVPKIDLSKSNVSNSAKMSYEDTGFIKIEIDITNTPSSATYGGRGGFSGNTQRWIHYIGNLTGKYLYNETNSTIHYLINHQISKEDSSRSFIHYLSIDNYSGVGSSDKFTLMTVCTDTTHPDKLSYGLYNLSQTNVINPITNKFYESVAPNRDWTASTLNSSTMKFYGKEAIVKGMYVIADCDGMGSDYLVHRTDTHFTFSTGSYSVLCTDGINQIASSMEVIAEPTYTSSNTISLTFPSMKKLVGSVSIGETFSTSVIGTIKPNVDYVKIVTPFDIQTEAEEIADDILSSMGIDYTKTNQIISSIVSSGSSNINIVTGSQSLSVGDNIVSSAFPSGTTITAIVDSTNITASNNSTLSSTLNITYKKKPYYIGSNFDGQDAFSAINSVLDYKDSKLTVDGESFSVVSNESNKDYRSIRFDEDSNDYNIVSFKRDISIYDKFNSVVIIGDSVRGIAKNHKEIQRDGAEKTKEIYDFSITSQVQADEKARKLLKVFSTLSNAIQLEIGSDIPHLEPGQIVELKFEREGIFRGDYIVIEISKQSGFPTKLLLGAYNKDLATTISLLLGETRNLQGRNKEVYKSYISPSISLQTTKIKFVGIKITSTTVSGASTSVIGFGKTIGFSGGIGL